MTRVGIRHPIGTGGGGGGSFDPTITSPQAGDVIYYNGTQWVNIPSEDIVADFTTLLDEVDEVTTYVGYAQPGTLQSASSWKIKKITTTGNDLEIEYADGVKTFTKAWDDRATFSYS